MVHKSNRMILKRLTIILTIFLLVSGFTSNKESITGQWLLVCISDLQSGNNSFRPENYYDGKLLFKFKDDGKTGKFTGQTILNTISGDYELFENKKMSISDFGGDKVLEWGWGSQFWGNIRSASSYRYASDTLLIYFESDTKIQKFAPIK